MHLFCNLFISSWIKRCVLLVFLASSTRPFLFSLFFNNFLFFQPSNTAFFCPNFYSFQFFVSVFIDNLRRTLIQARHQGRQLTPLTPLPLRPWIILKSFFLPLYFIKISHDDIEATFFPVPLLIKTAIEG